MIIKCIGFKNYFKKVEELKLNKASFVVTKTSATNKIQILDILGNTAITYLYSDQHCPMSLFPIMKQAKSEVYDNAKKVKEAPFSENPFDIKYYEFAETLVDLVNDSGSIYEYKDVYECDITGAYYRAAVNLGFISKEFFDKCMALKKIHRLKVLGSIATSKRIYSYKDGKLEEDPIVIQDDFLRSAWFKICSYINDAMQVVRACTNVNFLFYWVDGIYIRMPKKSDVDIVKKQVDMLTEDLNFEWKVEKLKNFKLINEGDKIEIQIEKHKPKADGSKDIRYFYPPKEKIKYYGVGNDKNFMQI